MKAKMPLLIVMFLLISCSTSENIDNLEEVVIVNTSNALEKYSFSDLLHLEDYLKLGNNLGTYIHKIDRLEFYNGKIYLLNDAGGDFESILVFDEKNGLFSHSIGRSGEGPGEYTGLRDFVIDKSKRQIICLVAGKMALITYDLEGKVLDNNRTNIWSSEIEQLDENHLLVYNEFNSTDASGLNHFLKLNLNGKIVKKFRPYSDVFDNLPINYSGSLTKFSNDFYYMPAYGDIIYSLGPNEKWIPKWKLDFGAKSIPDHYFNSPDKLNGPNTIDNSFLGNICLPFKRYLVFSFKDGRANTFGFYNKENGEFFTSRSVKNDFLKYILRFGHLSAKDNNTLVYALNAEKFIYLKKNNKIDLDEIKTKSPKLYEAVKDIKLTSNPVLLYFKWK